MKLQIETKRNLFKEHFIAELRTDTYLPKVRTSKGDEYYLAKSPIHAAAKVPRWSPLRSAREFFSVDEVMRKCKGVDLKITKEIGFEPTVAYRAWTLGRFR